MKKPDFEDDGRVIAPMDGVPQSSLDAAGWLGHMPGHLPGSRAPKSGGEAAGRAAADGEDGSTARPWESAPTLTPRETRSFIGGALLAALAVGGVFAAGFALFILFCTQVWLR